MSFCIINFKTTLCQHLKFALLKTNIAFYINFKIKIMKTYQIRPRINTLFTSTSNRRIFYIVFNV